MMNPASTIFQGVGQGVAEPAGWGWGVLLLGHGAPDRLEDVPEFLLNVRRGRRLSEQAVQEIVKRYAMIGGGSPLLRITYQQAGALARTLNARSEGAGLGGRRRAAIPVCVGMRNWKPYIPEAIRQLKERKAGRIVVACLAPQNSGASVGLYRKALSDAVAQIAPQMQVEFIESWHDHAGLIAAYAEKVSSMLERAEVTAGQTVPIIFTAHSVPQKAISDPYERQVRETAALVAQRLGRPEWRVAFQSQGMTEEPWLGPTVESAIDLLVAAGHRHALIAPVGFVSDHLEVLYDIDVGFRNYGRNKGLTVWRSESLNDSPLFVQALASLVSARMKQKAESRSW